MSIPGRGRRAFAVTFAAAAIGCALAAGAAYGVAQTIVTSDSPNAYSLAVYTMDQGDRPTLQNVGADRHDATARLNGPDGEFLFKSPTITNGTTTVDGTQYLTTGSYQFFCTTHPLEMQATLQVSASGSPVARPQIDVTLGAGKLSKIAKKGTLPVTVKAATASSGVELEVKLGKAKIGSQKAFNLAPGQSRKLAVKLTKSGKSKLADRNSAKLKVTGEVPFGAPDTGKRTYSG